MFFSRFDKFAAVFFVVVLAVIFVSAVSVDLSKPYHILQQVAMSSTDNTSIDQDANGQVDLADAATKVLCPDGTYQEVGNCGLGFGDVIIGDLGGSAEAVSFSVYSTSPQTVTYGTPVKANWTAEAFDNWDAFDLTNDEFTAPMDGVYSFYAGYTYQTVSGSAGLHFYLNLYKNGVLYKQGYQMISALVDLNAGDKVQIYLKENEGSGSDTTVPAKESLWFMGNSLGGSSGGTGGCSLAKTGLVDVPSTLCNGGYCNYNTGADAQTNNKVCELLGYSFFASNQVLGGSTVPTSYSWEHNGWATAPNKEYISQIDCWKEDCSGTGGTGGGCSLVKTGLIDVPSNFCNGVYCARYDQFQQNKVCEMLGYKFATTDLVATASPPALGQCALWDGERFNLSYGSTNCGYYGIAKIDCWGEDCSAAGGASGASLPSCAVGEVPIMTSSGWGCKNQGYLGFSKVGLSDVTLVSAVNSSGTSIASTVTSNLSKIFDEDQSTTMQIDGGFTIVLKLADKYNVKLGQINMPSSLGTTAPFLISSSPQYPCGGCTGSLSCNGSGSISVAYSADNVTFTNSVTGGFTTADATVSGGKYIVSPSKSLLIAGSLVSNYVKITSNASSSTTCNPNESYCNGATISTGCDTPQIRTNIGEVELWMRD